MKERRYFYLYSIVMLAHSLLFQGCDPWCSGGSFDPDIYRPRGIRVPLQLIDPNL